VTCPSWLLSPIPPDAFSVTFESVPAVMKPLPVMLPPAVMSIAPLVVVMLPLSTTKSLASFTARLSPSPLIVAVRLATLVLISELAPAVILRRLPLT